MIYLLGYRTLVPAPSRFARHLSQRERLKNR